MKIMQCDYLINDEDENRDYGRCKRLADWRIIDTRSGEVVEYLCTQHKQRLEKFGFTDVRFEKIV